MTRRLWQSGAIAITSGLVLASLAGAPAGAEVADPDGFHTAAVASAEQQRITEYWTPDRMRAAVPMDQLVSPDSIPAAAEVPAGEPVTVAPTAATDLAAPEPEASNLFYAPDAASLPPRSLPNGGGAWTGGGAITRAGGRVFFTFDGRNASCSGDAVTSGNKSVVITAGHCVKYQGAWHTNWTFVPGYDNGKAPYGTWTAKATLSTPQWTASEDINFDVGAAVVNPLDGKLLTDVVGAQGIAFNQARGQTMYSFGYPAADPYDGTKLIYCSGTVIDDFLLSDDIGLDCDMTGGASGGPWFLQFNEADGTGVQNSVNSFKYNFLPNYMFGPYFGADAQNLYNTAQTS